MAKTVRGEKNTLKKVFAYGGLFILAFLMMEALIIGSAMVGNFFLARLNPTTSSFVQAFEFRQFRRAGRDWRDLSQISNKLIRAVLVAEDDAFFKHEGVDIKEMKKSWEINIRKKRIVRGGSTLTMQLAKNLYLSPNKTPVRKLNEIILAFDLEARLSKSRILEIYLNVVEWGEGIYGVQAASQHYFNKDANSLSAGEAAYLAALLPNPIYYSQKGKRRAQRRKNIILRRMYGRKLPKDL